MKSKFLIYALVFTVLLVVFQYVNSMRIIEKYENDIEVFKMKIEKLETENTALKAQKD
tara:strand:- start:6821 stop:6994 length:174 start_codon:yes stop_codon:yes gene_type:complete